MNILSGLRRTLCGVKLPPTTVLCRKLQLRLGLQLRNALVDVTLLIVPRTVLIMVGYSGRAMLLTFRSTMCTRGRDIPKVPIPPVTLVNRQSPESPKKRLPINVTSLKPPLRNFELRPPNPHPLTKDESCWFRYTDTFAGPTLPDTQGIITYNDGVVM